MDKHSVNIDLEGNIDTPLVVNKSFKERVMAISMSNASAREWFAKTRDGIRPWGEFANTQRFQTPKAVAPLPKRIVKNIEHFQSNYLFVFIGLVIVCILTSPLLLVAIGACLGACYVINIRNKDSKLKLMGRELTIAQQYGVVGLCSFPLFWLAGAGSAVFWIIGASVFVIMLHASFYTPGDEGEPFDLEMEPV
ncbi:prenylated Rab acceptor protein 1-like [Mya arenaria]|uniref:prenylated Rab acceptor protein 1-like n=1 Tax=Mya arenaria TaxID=6604 RepID=UPI0022E79AF7|nr:prenylated Rab acceptor protein 1-like [Mya arenaria]